MHKEIAEFLGSHKESLEKIYTWDFAEKIPKEQFGIIAEGDTWLARNLDLKTKLANRIADNHNMDELTRIADYYIKNWGGIRRFTRASEIVEQFREISGTKNPPENFEFPFDSISSWSKWASLICPNWACIYDARVAYSINVINYLTGAKYKIFPIPNGRNTRLGMLDVKTLLLSAKIEVEDNSEPAALRRKYFISEKDVYRAYLKIVQEVSKQLWTDESHIHEVEMLLFAIADSVAYESLFNSLAQQRK